ncbi:MAG: AAA-associated domain-containing protein [Desulfurococcaceae archaeon]|nr:AAA-associated domain-containing protein [Desulfurococcaceae archaeon]
MSSSEHIYILPHNVQPDHVLGFLEAIYSLGDSVDPMNLGDLLGEQVDILPHVIDVASSLKLIEVKENGNIKLTKLGVEVVKGHVQLVKSKLRDVIENIEPFKTIINKLKAKKKLTVEEFTEISTRFYPHNTREAINTILQWGAFLGLFKMSTDDKYIYLIKKVGK